MSKRKILGRGCGGSVYVETTAKGKELAVKAIKNDVDGQREAKIHGAVCAHKNIISLWQVCKEGETLLLKMPRKKYTLLDAVRRSGRGRLSERRARLYFSHLMSALRHIHKAGYVHKDVKLENILLSRKRDRIFLADFGFARSYVRGHRTTDAYGSVHYSAPEIWLEQPHEGPEVDIWCAGVTLYLLTTGTFPFGGHTAIDICRSTVSQELRLPGFLSPELCDLLSRMLCKNLQQRPSVRAIRRHPWLRPSRSGKSPLQHVRVAASDSDLVLFNKPHVTSPLKLEHLHGPSGRLKHSARSNPNIVAASSYASPTKL